MSSDEAANQKATPPPQPTLVRRTGPQIAIDRSRVLLRRLYPSSHAKAENIASRVAALEETAVELELSKVLDTFQGRHAGLRAQFKHRYREVCLNLHTALGTGWSDDRKCLLGSFFLLEYSVESAALFNPSIVPHPDQQGVEPGSLRVVISLRATGEGHISSICFREAVLTHHNRIILTPCLQELTDAKRQSEEISKAFFLQEMKESAGKTKAWKETHDKWLAAVMAELPDPFFENQLRDACCRILEKCDAGSDADGAADYVCQAMLMHGEANYSVRFGREAALSQKILFPSAPSQSNGIEDARFIRFVDDGGEPTYYATFTAYNGRRTLSQIIQTKDFNDFRFRPLTGDVKEKGMALFPRKVNGQYVMLSRQDDESVMITFSQSLLKWEDPVPLLKPEQPWESFKMGNCGSPVETSKGWIVITHGVGPLRRYCIGAALLALDDPSRVIARLKEPLLAPNEAEREGYVPNVVYSCGCILHGDDLVIPYAMSDSVSSFALVNLEALFRAFESAKN